ncbi:hypothetical protein A8F94_00965 [Bacillus sp. FJAT-27225]|uniref:hypothetical protein n=1 Tax=Bacillus sp. FJAT-27225 TaxID=1743144 RepID=UPI00080C2815|nr:hypothetical protein [Bacillus sp. FJAT-27225]OCA90490.1 hypothetical protein A8F94_00965 [Bacillus sp. FJAT-27225]
MKRLLICFSIALLSACNSFGVTEDVKATKTSSLQKIITAAPYADIVSELTLNIGKVPLDYQPSTSIIEWGSFDRIKELSDDLLSAIEILEKTENKELRNYVRIDYPNSLVWVPVNEGESTGVLEVSGEYYTFRVSNNSIVNIQNHIKGIRSTLEEDRMLIQRRIGTADTYEEVELTSLLDRDKIRNILGDAAWENAKVQMADLPDFKIVDKYLIWVNTNNIQIIFPAQNQYTKITGNGFKDLYEILSRL